MSNLCELTEREVDIVCGGSMPRTGYLSNNIIFLNIGNTVGAEIGQQANGSFSLNGAGVMLGSLGL
jgi:hypothetical protein